MDEPGRSIGFRSRFRRIMVGGVVLGLVAVPMLFASGPAQATFPGPNGRLAFTDRTVEPPEIWTFNSNGNYGKRLTEGFQPSYNEHGSRVVYIVRMNDGIQQIFHINANKKLRTQVTNSDRNYANPSYAPDSEGRVVASGWRGNNWKNLWLVRLDGKGEKRFTDGNYNDVDPEWSPDGSRIAWTRYKKDGTYDVFVKHVNGAVAKRLTGGKGNCKGAAFSPDGTRIVFTRVSGPKNTGRLFTINVDGSGREQLTINPAGTMYDHAVFSPNGNEVAFVRQVDAIHTVPEIFKIKYPGGSGMTNLSQGYYWPTDVDWGVG